MLRVYNYAVSYETAEGWKSYNYYNSKELAESAVQEIITRNTNSYPYPQVVLAVKLTKVEITEQEISEEIHQIANKVEQV